MTTSGNTRLVLDEAGALALEFDDDGRVRWASRAVALQLDTYPTDLVGKTVDDLPGATGREVRRMLLDLRSPWRMVTLPSGTRLATRRTSETADVARLFELSIDLICIADQDGYFTRLNPRWTTALGWSVDDLMGRPFLEFVHPDDIHATLAEMQHLADGQPSMQFVNRYRYPDGSYRWLSWNSSTDPDTGLIYAVARDVTKERELEVLKDEFVSTVSHELRTPLTSIRGSLGLLAAHERSRLSSGMASMLDVALRNAVRLTELINDLLDLSGLSQGALPLDLQDTALATLLQEAADDHAGAAAAAEVAIEVSTCPADVTVQVDVFRMRQVLGNLLSNAVKYSRPGTTVLLSCERDDAATYIRVADRGPGIPEAFRERVFDRFAQADASTTRTRGGTGLGLAISQQIVHRHQGRIDFVTSPNGTTFTVTLPHP